FTYTSGIFGLLRHLSSAAGVLAESTGVDDDRATPEAMKALHLIGLASGVAAGSHTPAAFLACCAIFRQLRGCWRSPPGSTMIAP
ncbi:hypothetical protein CKJ89_37135, partial [Klebsiella pneumoniae]